MIKYYSIQDPSLCSGCMGCYNICPTGAINFKPNEEGFLYPDITVDKCIKCNLCSKICPFENEPSKKVPLDMYAFQNSNDHDLSNSSSGGFFRLLTNYVLSKDGYVVGAVMDEDYVVNLEITNDQNVIEKMMGSKYVYCRPNDIYNRVKEKLDQGVYVLFTGSPCECAAMKNVLKKEYSNLILAEFLCYGMPSELVLASYITVLNKKGKISDIKFRDKSYKGWGKVFSYKQKGKKRANIETTDPYLYGFISGYFNRWSCYNCEFRGEKRFTDFTFSDYWEVQKYHSEINIQKGVSAVSINTEKAKAIQEELKDCALWIQSKREYAGEGNPALLDTPMAFEEKIPPLRQHIYSDVSQYGWKWCEKKYFRPRKYLYKKIWYKIPRNIAKKIKSIVK